MRLIIVILMLSSIYCVNADLDIAIEEKCVNQVGIDLDTFRHKAHTRAVLSTNDEDQKVKCVILCIAEAANIMKSDGTRNVNGLIAEVGGGIRNYNYAREIANACDIKGENACDTAYKLYDCINKKILAIASREYNKDM